MAPRKSGGNRKNEPMADVVTRRSGRIAGVGTKSDSIVGTAAWEVTKPKRRRQASPSRGGKNVAVPAVHQGISSVSGGRPPRNEPNASIDSARNASCAPRNSRISTGDTPRPTSKARSGAVSVSRAAKGARETPRGDEGGASPPVARNGLRIDDGTPIPDENLDAADQARSKDRTSASPVAHVSETGASRGQKRRSQDAQNDDPPSVTGKRTRKSTEHPPPKGGIGAPSKPPSENPGHETSPPEPREQRFGDILLRAVVTDRALRERRQQHEECDRLIKHARYEAEGHRGDPEFNPRSYRAELEANMIRKRSQDKDTADRKVKYMERQLGFCVDELKSFSHVSREDDGLEFLAGCDGFWLCFGRFRKMLREKHDLDIELEGRKQALTALDDATKQLYGRIFQHGDRAPIPAIVETNVFGDLDDLPGVMARLETFEERNSNLEKALKSSAQNVLWSAEFVFVRSGVLVHESILYTWDDFSQGGMHDQGDWPEREHGRGQEVLPAYESVYAGGAPSEEPGHEPPPPEPSRGQRFSDILLRAVVVNRALSETQDRYEGNHRRISDLRRQIALVQEEFNTNWLDQSEAEQDIGRRIANLEALLPEPERNK
jgi:hypothetical protein